MTEDTNSIDARMVARILARTQYRPQTQRILQKLFTYGLLLLKIC